MMLEVGQKILLYFLIANFKFIGTLACGLKLVLRAELTRIHCSPNFNKFQCRHLFLRKELKYVLDIKVEIMMPRFNQPSKTYKKAHVSRPDGRVSKANLIHSKH
jgi:hypothetical protein